MSFLKYELLEANMLILAYNTIFFVSLKLISMMRLK